MGIHCTVRETDSRRHLWVMVSTAPSYTTVPLQVSGLYSACLSISSHPVNCQLTFLWKCVEPLLESQIKRSIRSFHPAYRKQLKTKSLQSLTCTWQYARHSEVQTDKDTKKNIKKNSSRWEMKRKKLRLRENNFRLFLLPHWGCQRGTISWGRRKAKAEEELSMCQNVSANLQHEALQLSSQLLSSKLSWDILHWSKKSQKDLVGDQCRVTQLNWESRCLLVLPSETKHRQQRQTNFNRPILTY